MTNLGARIQPEVRSGAKWLLVGEAPGEEEMAAGRPFVGKSGQLLERALAQAGMSRDDFSITNVCQYRPPANKIEKWLGKEVDQRVITGIAELELLIGEIKPEAILTVGNTSLWALLGLRQITSRRGSPLLYDGKPLLPTLHPAAVLRDYKEEALFIHDLRRFRKWAGGDLRLRNRKCIIRPTPDEVEAAYKSFETAKSLAVDIEAEGSRLSCVGFSSDPNWAICLPYEDEYLEAIAEYLMLPCAKVLHNATYDLAFLQDRAGLHVAGRIDDTMVMHRTMLPELSASLETLTSLYTTQPYYKDMGVNWKDTANYDQFYTYNCLDCSVTIECFNALNSKLNGAYASVRNAYERRIKMIQPAVDMSKRGFLYDKVEAKRVRHYAERDLDRWQRILEGYIGHKVNVFSPDQVKKLLYEELKLPVQRGADKKVTTGQKHLMTLYATIPDPRLQKILKSLIRVRGLRKFISSYLKVKLSPEGRVRSSFSPCGTETGRWSASKYLITEGVNLQTVPMLWKSCIRADEGKVLWAADYSQIEARFVAYDAKDKAMIQIFETPKGDIHKANASRIYKVPIDKVTDDQRQMAKKCVHALNYNIGPKELMLQINKVALDTGQWITLNDAKRIRQLYLEQFDTIVAWQERQWNKIRTKKAIKDRVLTNPFGSAMIFMGPVDGKGAEHTKNAAIAFVPQSTVPDMLNLAILALRENPPAPGFEMLAQIHDAIIGQGPPESMDVWAPAIKQAMDIPVTLGGKECRVPVELKVGPNWKNMKKVS